MGEVLDEEERRARKKILPRHPPQAGQGTGSLRPALHSAGTEVESGRPCLRVGKLTGGNRTTGHTEETEMPVSQPPRCHKGHWSIPTDSQLQPRILCVVTREARGHWESLMSM